MSMAAGFWARLRGIIPEDGDRRAGLKRELEHQRNIVARQQVELLHSKKIFDRASEAARIGVWECSLPGEELRWTEVVYDLFDLPRGSKLERARTLECYPKESRRSLEEIRSRAIAERSGFTLDAEITTFKGRQRWIRITATVECENGEPVRIFGMKQDITEEKILADRNRYLAEFDVMTGLANRSRFQTRMHDGAPIGALLLVDLDRFKSVNDTFGHMVGDECLCETARRLEAAAPGASLIARLGGDEFAILLGPTTDRVDAASIARRIVEALARPLDLSGRSLTLGASVGVAHAEAGRPDHLYSQADAALYAAKGAGRATFRIFKPASQIGKQDPRAAA